jgi:hypothetical protein
MFMWKPALSGLVCALLFLTGCGNGRSALPPASDVTGMWNFFIESDGLWSLPNSTDLSMQPDGNFMGTSSLGDVTGFITGHDMTMTVTGMSVIYTFQGTIDDAGTLITGSWTNSEPNSGTWRAEKI